MTSACAVAIFGKRIDVDPRRFALAQICADALRNFPDPETLSASGASWMSNVSNIEQRRYAGFLKLGPPLDRVVCKRSMTSYEFIHARQADAERRRGLPVSVFSDRLGLSERLVAGKTVLIAGCGLGNELRAVQCFNPAMLVAVDLSRYVHNLREAIPASFCRADVLMLPFADDSFDLVLNAGVMHHLADPERGFRELHRVTKPGGILSIGSIYPPHELNLRISAARERYGFHRMAPAAASARLRRALIRRVILERLGLGHLAERVFGLPLGNPQFAFDVRFGEVLDTYLPEFRHVIHPATVRGWFRAVAIEPSLPANFKRFFADAQEEQFGCPTQNVGVKVHALREARFAPSLAPPQDPLPLLDGDVAPPQRTPPR